MYINHNQYPINMQKNANTKLRFTISKKIYNFINKDYIDGLNIIHTFKE